MPWGSIPQQRFVANGVIINGNAKKDGIDTFRFGGVPIGSVGHWERHEIASFVADGKVLKGFAVVDERQLQTKWHGGRSI
jgi:hypothetical protein